MNFRYTTLTTALLVLLSSSLHATENYNFVIQGDGASISSVREFEVKELGNGFHQVRVKANNLLSARKVLATYVDDASISEDATIKRYVKKSEPLPFVLYQNAVTEGVLSNDPLLVQQENLMASGDGVGAGVNDLYEGIQYQREDNKKIRVAILDTGSLGHEDLVFKGGYSFTTLFDASESEDYKDLTEIETDDITVECSSGHGIGMASIIGATSNNGVGMYGLANVDLFMGRVAATDCNAIPVADVAKLSDVTEGILWASASLENGGVEADVINISLSGESVCPLFMQEAINVATSRGSIIVVAAGNDASVANGYAPANCDGVITVGANHYDGGGTAYTNKGDVVDITALGEALVATPNNTYGKQDGTSISAAYVSGVVARMKSNFPSLNQERVEWVLRNTAKPFASAIPVDCSTGCGLGILNFEAALKKAELVHEPIIAFNHPYAAEDGQCTTDEAIAVLGDYLGVCDVMLANVVLPHLNEGLNYELRLLKKPKDVEWGHSQVELIRVLNSQPSLKSITSIAIHDGNSDTHDYGVVACDGEECPFVETLVVNPLLLPEACL